ncbi:hypothetical protein ACFPOU_05670 [Massilia jejuensis]|uniref:Uncharacterized protein n=1 Tax=Massilia jejuensis TaxID=648894 RepID=A0ABW0PG96_9BURK
MRWTARPNPPAAHPSLAWLRFGISSDSAPGSGHLVGFAPIRRRRATSLELAGGVRARSVTAPWSG